MLPANSDIYRLWSCADLLTLEVTYWKLRISDSGHNSISSLQSPQLKMKEFTCAGFFLTLFSTYIPLHHYLPLSLTVSLFPLFQALIGISQFGMSKFYTNFYEKLNKK